MKHSGPLRTANLGGVPRPAELCPVSISTEEPVPSLKRRSTKLQRVVLGQKPRDVAISSVIMAANNTPKRVPTMMKPFLSSVLAFALLFSTLVAGPARAAESGKGQAVQDSPATEADGKAFAAAEALYAAGQYAEAEKAALALVAARTQALGAEARETLRARVLLAEALRMQGKAAESEA